jgi:pimeloyl-ACP methyl ester carboxylesterase
VKPGIYKQITVDGVRLNYLEVEPDVPTTKPPLLVLHQLLATAETLTDLISRLPSDRRIVAVDILSAEPASGTLDLRSQPLARLITAFARARAMERPIVIGHSHGGTIALWLAAMQETPSALDVQGLILLAPAHPFAGYRAHVVAFYLTRWGRFLALRIPLAPSRMILWAYNQAAGPARPITFAQFRPHLTILRSRKALARVLEILRTWETDMTLLRTALTAHPIQQPTLLLWGDHDVIVPASSAASLEAHLDRYEKFILTGRGHLLPQESPEDCTALIRTWLMWLETNRLSSGKTAAATL